jgi:hypothetical protein
MRANGRAQKGDGEDGKEASYKGSFDKDTCP